MRNMRKKNGIKKKTVGENAKMRDRKSESKYRNKKKSVESRGE